MIKSMTMTLLNEDSFIRQYRLEEVTSKKILNAGNEINPTGLFSYEIFGGFGSQERLNTFAYINLHAKFIQPFIYSSLMKRSPTIYGIITGELRFSIIDKELVIEESGMFTGLESLYLYWDEFIRTIKETDSEERKDLLEILKNRKKEELWCDKWIVIPAGLRDINLMDLESSGFINYEPINDLYIKLLSLSGSLEHGHDFFTSDKTNRLLSRIQDTLLDIHNFIMLDKMSGKEGYLRKRSLKKAVIYSVGGVIAASPQMQHTYNSTVTNNIKLGEIGIPVSVLIDLFYPFVIHYTKLFFETEQCGETLNTVLKKYIKDYDHKAQTDIIEEFLNLCINDKKFIKLQVGEQKDNKGNVIPIYVMDILKNAIMIPIVGEKGNPKRYTITARYPINNLQSDQILIPIPYTTASVELVTLDTGQLYQYTKDPQNYSTAFIIDQNSLPAFGGDFDGDIITVTGIFTDDANEDITRNNKAFKYNNLTLSLEPNTNIGIENLLGLNVITR